MGLAGPERSGAAFVCRCVCLCAVVLKVVSAVDNNVVENKKFWSILFATQIYVNVKTKSDQSVWV